MKRSPGAARRRLSDAEVDELRARLQEAEETLDAIRNGQVEALVVNSATGPRVFTLEGADHRYRRLVETMNEGALLLNPHGLILYSNAAFADLAGERLERIAGRSLVDIVDPSSRAKFDALLSAARASRVADELCLRREDGAEVATHVSMSPNEDEELGICAIVTNLTAQKRNEEMLASERLASSILEQAVEAIIVCDNAGVITRASRPARAIASSEPIHQHVLAAFPLRPVLPDTVHPAVLALEGKATVGVEWGLDRAGGEAMSLLCTAAPLVNDRDQILGCVLSLVDITERKRAEAERAELLDAERAARALAERARAEAEASNRSKDEFLATVSHELRTPLNAIVGWARMMSEGMIGAAQHKKGIEVIRRNADAQARLIEDLLDVSRIISGKMKIESLPVEPRPIIEAVLESVRPALEAKEIALETILDPGRMTILGDASRLQQVIWNLVSNAAKFTPRAGRITIALRRVDANVEVRVTDTGRGIGVDFLPYVFDRFRQADGGISRAHGGLGLGLAISRHLVELHGGRIEVASAGEGKGSSFTIRLPDCTARRTPEGTDSDVPPSLPFGAPTFVAADLRHVTIIVVEDDDDSRELLVSILTTCGAKVRAACSSMDALALLEEAPADVLISDIGMPIMNGYALIRKVRSLPDPRLKKMPALALTAYARAEDHNRALAEGFQMHLVKPVDPSELASVVASLSRR